MDSLYIIAIPVDVLGSMAHANVATMYLSSDDGYQATSGTSRKRALSRV